MKIVSNFFSTFVTSVVLYECALGQVKFGRIGIRTWSTIFPGASMMEWMIHYRGDSVGKEDE
jgi:hypothetical protein